VSLFFLLGQRNFLPTQMAGVAAWYDSADTSSIVSSAGAVSQWNDKSGNGYHATQGAAANQPVTNATTQNGKNVIDFATNDRLVLPSGLHSIPNASNTIFCVGKRNTDSTAQVMVIFEEGSTNYRAGMFFASLAGQVAYRNDTGAGTNAFLTGVTTTNFNAFCGSFNGTTGQSVSVNNGTPVTNTSGSAESGITIGSIGAGNAALALTGSVAELIIWNRELSTAEKSVVFAYLRAKWGLP